MAVMGDNKGQATTEMVVSILALMIVFAGLMQIAELGSKNIQMLISARGQADNNVRSGVLTSGGAKSIGYWDKGDDNLYFTADDNSISPETPDNSEFFQKQLQTPLDLSDSATSLIPANHNFVPGLNAANLFLDSAALISGTSTSPTSVEISDIMRSLVYDAAQIDLEQTVFMPSPVTE